MKKSLILSLLCLGLLVFWPPPNANAGTIDYSFTAENSGPFFIGLTSSGPGLSSASQGFSFHAAVKGWAQTRVADDPPQPTFVPEITISGEETINLDQSSEPFQSVLWLADLYYRSTTSFNYQRLTISQADPAFLVSGGQKTFPWTATLPGPFEINYEVVGFHWDFDYFYWMYEGTVTIPGDIYLNLTAEVAAAPLPSTLALLSPVWLALVLSNCRKIVLKR